MRDKLRKIRLLHAVEAAEIDADSWPEMFECFQERHIRFI
jgi:hypothetical protein